MRTLVAFITMSLLFGGILCANAQTAEAQTRAVQSAPVAVSSSDGVVIPPPGGADGTIQFSTGSSPGVDALEGAVDAGYRLGPGDRLGIYLWGEPPITFDSRVTLDGKVIIPQVGEVDVLGRTLSEARTDIARTMASRFRNQKISVSLLQLRRFQVHVTGQVQTPGAVLTSSADRVLDAIALVGGALEDASLRNIEIRRSDGAVIPADVFRYLKTGEISGNPTLRDGDVVHVPFRGPEVFLYGAVKSDGPYEVLPSDTLADLVRIAGGTTDRAAPDSVEVTRFIGGDETTRLYVNLDRAGDSFQLQPDDQILFPSRLNWHRRHVVDLRGEVHSPGTFAIVDGETRISEVIERAGGFTDLAFLEEASVIRRRAIRLDDKEYERLRLMSASEMTDDEYEYFKMKSREEKGLMVVDFVKLRTSGDPVHDILLRSGDLIEIPPQKDFVSVLGEVATPGNIVHESGVSADDYIQMAGGYADNADRGKVRVIRVATGEWVDRKDAGEIRAGDTIWVPEKAERNYWNIFKESLAVVTQILTVYLIVDRATQN